MPRRSHGGRWALGVVALAAALLRPPLAAAQPAGVPSPEARMAFESGVRDFDAGEFTSALDGFRRAWDLSHRASVLLNIGVTYVRLRRPAEAIEVLERFLTTVPPAPDAQLQRAEDALAEARAQRQESGPVAGPPAPSPTPPSPISRPPPAAPLPPRATAPMAPMAPLVTRSSITVAPSVVLTDPVRVVPRAVTNTDALRVPLTVIAVTLGIAAVGLGVGAVNLNSDFHSRYANDPAASGVASRGASLGLAADLVGIAALITGGFAAWRWTRPYETAPEP